MGARCSHNGNYPHCGITSQHIANPELSVHSCSTFFFFLRKRKLLIKRKRSCIILSCSEHNLGEVRHLLVASLRDARCWHTLAHPTSRTSSLCGVIGVTSFPDVTTAQQLHCGKQLMAAASTFSLLLFHYETARKRRIS